MWGEDVDVGEGQGKSFFCTGATAAQSCQTHFVKLPKGKLDISATLKNIGK